MISLEQGLLALKFLLDSSPRGREEWIKKPFATSADVKELKVIIYCEGAVRRVKSRLPSAWNNKHGETVAV